MCGRSQVSAVVTSASQVAFAKAQDAAFNRTLQATQKARTNKKGNLTVEVFDALNDIILARGDTEKASDSDKDEVVRAVEAAIRRVNAA